MWNLLWGFVDCMAVGYVTHLSVEEPVYIS